jgi:hypothetical protein
LALPLVTVLVVLYSMLFAGVPRTITGVRIYGGPTEGVSRLALRVVCVTRDGESESAAWPGPLSVRATTSRETVTARVEHAQNGVAEVALALAAANHGPLAVEVRDAFGGVLASGRVELDSERWAAHARRRGGWTRGPAHDALIVSIAPERGAFVTGESDPLLIRVERAGVAASGVKLTLHADGATVSGAENLLSDAHGIARVNFEARDLNPTLHVDAQSVAGEIGMIDSGVLIVPGGFHVLARGSGITVENSVPRSEAYFSLVSEHQRVKGGVLTLAQDKRGYSVATFELGDVPHPAWLVVSSDVDENSIAAIGWPLDPDAEPAQTFDVREARLLDGLPGVFAREQARRSLVRWLTAGFVALALALSAVLLVFRVRAAGRDIARHLQENLEGELVKRVAPQRGLALLIAVLAIGLGFILLGLIALARTH